LRFEQSHKGATAQRHKGAAVKDHNGAMAQGRKGAAVKDHNGAMVQRHVVQ